MTTAPPGAKSIAEILDEARTRLDRLGPAETDAAVRDGAVLIDIRPAAQRAEHGEIPGALIIERNVLEWRLDPRSDARLPFADRYDLPVIITCQEGYTSSLAAAALQELGLHRATDLAGGFKAWREAGLPTRSV
ncbi:rhodanese-like domain-containing protein [Actinoplanes palleronii]|uniref:rhodanese-like domain-containing protein n=1 Tax=Actinoplanes palleronii TaxID=113570 RepID=UPI001944BE04|nr:rhodanese-like domain-containing protein [Actinoplanes palleronii]